MKNGSARGQRGRRQRTGKSEAAERGPVRFAVIGQGYFAQAAVLPAFANARGCELTAIFSDDARKLRALKRKYDVEHALAYEHYDEFLRSGAVDAVYIALPNDMHCDYTVRAARAGVHVLCEKPMAVTSAEAERMIAACEDARVQLMIAYRLHFEEANMAAVEAVRTGKIGEARFASMVFSQQIRPGNTRTRGPVRGGGPLYDIGIYCINAARYLFRAEPVEVTALAGSKPGDRRFRDSEEQVSALLRFPDDRLAQLTCSFGAYDQSSCRVIGSEGLLDMEPAFDFATDLAWRIEAGGRKQQRTFPKRDQVAPELIAFADCLRAGGDPEPSGREGLADLRVIEAIQRSLRSGRAARVDAVQRRRRPSLAQHRKLPAHGRPRLVGAESPGQG